MGYFGGQLKEFADQYQGMSLCVLKLYTLIFVQNSHLQVVFSTLPLCSQMPAVFYHSGIHILGFLICQLINNVVR